MQVDGAPWEAAYRSLVLSGSKQEVHRIALAVNGAVGILALALLAVRVGGRDASQNGEKHLSIGDQQRLAFARAPARALASAPSIVMLDEATSALDSTNEVALYKHLRASGTTLISIAHRPTVLKHPTHVLELKGEGAWQVHLAGDFSFDR